MSPGINGPARNTGTVPKTKTRNDASRGNTNGSRVRRQASYNSLPNNLLSSTDWPIQDHQRRRKNSNSQPAASEFFDFAMPSVEGVQEINGSVPMMMLSSEHPVESTGSHSGGVFSDDEYMNSSGASYHTSGPVQQTTSSTTQNSASPKATNIDRMPDRNQVLSRLNQIQDYIKQTSTLMDTLKNSEEPRHLEHYNKLSKLISDLRDSQNKLQHLLALSDLECQNQRTHQDSLNEALGIRETSLPRSNSQEPSTVKTETARSNELKIKVEEHQRKLQALHQQQAVLEAMQQHAMDQLKEARQAQSLLAAHSFEDSNASESSTDPTQISTNLQNVQERLQSLHQLYENRNQLAAIIGERDDDFVPPRAEHLELQDKLQELQNKKQYMDRLLSELEGCVRPSSTEIPSCLEEDDGQIIRDKVAELNLLKSQLAHLKAIMASAPGLENHPDVEMVVNDSNDQAVNLHRQNRSAERLVSRDNKPDNITQAAIELDPPTSQKALNIQEAKARLGHLRSLLATVTEIHRRGQSLPDRYLDMLHQELDNVDNSAFANLGASGDSRPTLLTESSEMGSPNRASRQSSVVSQPVSIKRPCSGMNSNAGTDPNRIGQSEITIEMMQAMTRDLKAHTLSLQEERDRLIAAQMELRQLHKDRPIREKKTNKQIDHHKTLQLQAELQAKREELVELMRKDQGRSSSINQDICSDPASERCNDVNGPCPVSGGGASGLRGTPGSWGDADDDLEDDEDEMSVLPTSTNLHSRRHSPCPSSGTTNRELLNMSMDSSLIRATATSTTSATSSGIGITGPPEPGPSGHVNQQMTQTHSRQKRSAPPGSAPSTGSNLWAKTSQGSLESAISTPRTIPGVSSAPLPTSIIWGTGQPHSGHEESTAQAASRSRAPSTEPSNLSTFLHPSSTYGQTAAPAGGWWQHQAMQLQHQLELTSALCQSLLSQQNPSLPQTSPASMTTTSSLSPAWPPLATPATTSAPMMPPWPGVEMGCYQQMLATSQLQQQMLLNQCCNLVWLAHREIASLRAVIHEKLGPISPNGEVMTPLTSGPGAPNEIMSSISPSNLDRPITTHHKPTTNDHQTHPSDELLLASAAAAAAAAAAVASSAIPSAVSGPSAPGQPTHALNNQVPPGNRANNYWDNFRSYSRQNFLSAAKSNEGASCSAISHSPSPLVDRSHNTLRDASNSIITPPLSATPQASSQTPSSGATGISAPIGATSVSTPAPATSPYHSLVVTFERNRKEKLNLEPTGSESSVVPSSSPTPTATATANPPVTNQPSPLHSLDLTHSLGAVKKQNPQSTLHERFSRSGNTLFDVLSAEVYSEVSGLIAANQNRPHYLIQLFRDLRLVSSDPLRQRALHSIQDLVSSYLHNHPNEEVEMNSSEESNCIQNVPVNEDKENESFRLGLNLSRTENNDQSIVLPNVSTSTSTIPLPRNPSWNSREELTLPNILDLNILNGKIDHQTAYVLENTMPLIGGHLDESLNPSFLESLRRTVIQWVPRIGPTGGLNSSSSRGIHENIDSLLEDALTKFQGQRLRDIHLEVLTTIAQVLVDEFSARSLNSSSSRNVLETNNLEECEGTISPSNSSTTTASQPRAQPDLLTANSAHIDTFDESPSPSVFQLDLPPTVTNNSYNGDLAEADQPHDVGATNLSSSPLLQEEAAGGIGVSIGLPLSTPSSFCNTESEMENRQHSDVLECQENSLLNDENCDGYGDWDVEEDRELGLDQVPSRLHDLREDENSTEYQSND